MPHTLFRAALGLGALASAVFASSAAMADSLQITGPDWDTEPFDARDGCYSATVLPNGVMLGFHYMLKGREFRLTLSSTEWEEQVPDEDTGPVAVTIHGPGGKRSLMSKEGYALKVEELEAVAGIWYGVQGDGVRNAFAKGDSFDVSYKGRSLGNFPLDGAGPALDALIDCAAELDEG